MGALAVQHRFQPRLALGKGKPAEIVAALIEQVEDEVCQIAGTALREGCLQRGKIGRAIVVERHHLAVDDAIGQA